ncbi:phage tail tape measure protein [Pseudomonas sp. 21LCFQ02]|uniref:phage tail tape measure protein n=1 Tax=Pseudomonas sp. 21LCFQ02 TaxID=2957505 RepID=UPI00209B4DD9|nr:phage tail tape measure protein [Pseudomonas sp. 21LCFQ02]MCO8166812.1 phage tail tape measure protein [Pseudomonas sp. 21LCFQ02]
MAMTSRLSIEIDSRSAEQKAEDMRRALQGLSDAGLRVNPAMGSAAGGMNSAGQGARSAQTQVQALERQIKSLAGMAMGVAGPLAAAFSAKALYDAAEAYTSLNSRMKLVTETGAQLAEAQQAVFQIAQSSYQPLAAMGELYQRIAQNQKELGISSKQVVGVVGTISKSLAVSGASASAANAALVQLGQAFASGTLRGEELNSVMEQAPALAQAIARGMGIGVGQLRMLGQEGKLTAEAVIKALESQEKAVADLFDKTNVTIGNSLTSLGNSATRFIGEMDQFTGTSAALSAQIVSLSKSIDSALPGALDTVASSSSTLEQIMTTGLYAAIGRVVGGLAQQAGSAGYAAAQSQKLASETAKTASTFSAYADREREAAKADLEKARAGVSAAEMQGAANNKAAADELKRRQATLQSIEAERAQAQQRVRNALSEEGRINAQAKLDDVNRRRVAAISQVTLAEQNLARVTQASTAQIQASLDQRKLAAGSYASTVSAANLSAAASEKAAAGASAFARSAAAMRAGVLSLTAALGGPVGLIITAAAVGASFIDFGSTADQATKALDQQGLTVDEIVRKYDALNASQQRIKRLEWIDEQKSSLASASQALSEYIDRINNSTLQGAFAAKGIGDLSGEFNKMIAEVKAGQRDLDSVNQWLKESIELTPQHEKILAKTSAEYTRNAQRSKELEQVLGLVNKTQKEAAVSAGALAAAQEGSGKQTKAQTAEIDKYLTKLREQVTLYGASKQRLAEYEASKLNMNDQQREEARILGQIQDKQEEYREALKKNDKARMESLKVELTALFTQKDASEEFARKSVETAQKAVTSIEKIHWASDQAMGESFKRRTQELVAFSNLATTLQAKPNFLTGESGNPLSLQGNSMRLPESWKPKGYVEPVSVVAPIKKTVAQQVADAIGQITETTDAANRAAKAYTESAGQKMLNQASEQAAVLREQSLIYDKQVGQVEKIGPEQQKLIKWEQELADIKSKQTLTADQKSLLANQEQITAALKANAAEEKRIQTKERLYELDKKSAEMLKNINAELALSQQELNNDLAGIGLGQEGRRRLQEDLKIRQDHQKKVNDLQDQLNKGEIDKATYDKQTGYLADALGQRLKMQQDYYRQLEIQQADWSNGANAAWQDYVESARDVAGQTYDLFSNAFQGMEDALVDFVMTGKLSFKELANSIIADIARILIRTKVVTPILNSLFGGAGGGGGIASAVAGGGSGGGFNLESAWNTVSGAYSVATSGFGSAVSAGWTAGEGFLGGVQGAFKAGAGYLSSSIGGLFAGSSGTMVNGVYQLGASAAPATVDLISNTVTNSATGAVTGTATGATTAATSGLAASSALMYGIGGAIQGYLKAGVKGAVAGAGGAVAGAYAGAAIGSAVPIIGNVIGAAIGAVLGGLFGSSLFGGDWITKDEGFQLGVTDGDLESYSFEYQKKKGGLFSSNKKRTRLTAMDEEMQAALDSTYATTLGSVIGLFDSLDVTLNDAVLDGLNVAATQISTRDKTAEEIQKEIADWFTVLADAAVGEVNKVTGSGLDGFNFESLTTFVSNLYSVNTSLDMIGVKMVDFNIAGGRAVENLVSLAGGIENLNKNMTTFYDNFTTDTQKSADVLDGVRAQFLSMGLTLPATREAFAEAVKGLDMTSEAERKIFNSMTANAEQAAAAYTILEARQQAYYSAFYSEAENTARSLNATIAQIEALGITLPATRAGFRKMVEALDLTTEKGRSTHDSLMSLAGAVGAVYDSAEQQLLGNANAAFAAVQRSVNAQKTSINDMITTARESASDLTSISNALSNAMKVLRGDSDEAVKMLRAQAQATVVSALAIAKAGGSLSGFEGLEDALSVISDNDTSLYGSLEDFNREQGRNANLVAELNGLTGKQLTASDKTIKALEDQLKGLDEQLLFAQSQLDALNGVDNSVKTVAQAIADMNAAVVAAISTISGKSTPANAGVLVDSIYKDVLGRDADTGGKQYWVDQLASGALNNQNIVGAITNAAAIEAAYKAAGIAMNDGASYWATQLTTGALTLSQLQEAVRNAAGANKSVPAFAMGGMHTGGIRLVGEKGPELEVTGPARIFNASQTAAMLKGGGGSAEVVAAIQLVQQLLWQISKNTGNSDTTLRRVVDSGVPIVGTVQVSGTVKTEGATA